MSLQTIRFVRERLKKQHPADRNTSVFSSAISSFDNPHLNCWQAFSVFEILIDYASPFLGEAYENKEFIQSKCRTTEKEYLC